MDVMGAKIYPDPNSKGIEYEPSEWELLDGPYARHQPTGLIFRVDCDEEILHRKAAAVNDFFACVVHACDHLYRADEGFDEEMMQFLGRGAIAFYLQAIGAWKPEVVSYPDRPEHKRIKRNYPNPTKNP